MHVTVCWKWVSVDGDTADERWAGVSPADEAALEVGLDITAAAGGGGTVTVVTVGPAAGESALRDAVAAGATRAVRIAGDQAASRSVARSIAQVAHGSDYVLCGDYSLDRGTGSVPAYLAAELDAAQALGLVGVDSSATPLRATRRLDGGRRELLDVPAPAVLSVEGSVARLRRASLAASLAAKQATIEVIDAAMPTADADLPVSVSAYRPRARVLAAPAGTTLGRVRDILDVGAGEAIHSETVELEPAAAARRIIEQLRDWDALPD